MVDQEQETPRATKNYFCPCCGSKNTRVSFIGKIEYNEPGEIIEPTTKVEIWCDNCTDLIGCSIEVPKSFEPHPDIGEYNIMSPLTRYLKDKE